TPCPTEVGPQRPGRALPAAARPHAGGVGQVVGQVEGGEPHRVEAGPAATPLDGRRDEDGGGQRRAAPPAGDRQHDGGRCPGPPDGPGQRQPAPGEPGPGQPDGVPGREAHGRLGRRGDGLGVAPPARTRGAAAGNGAGEDGDGGGGGGGAGQGVTGGDEGPGGGRPGRRDGRGHGGAVAAGQGGGRGAVAVALGQPGGDGRAHRMPDGGPGFVADGPTGGGQAPHEVDV